MSSDWIFFQYFFKFCYRKIESYWWDVPPYEKLFSSLFSPVDFTGAVTPCTCTKASKFTCYLKNLSGTVFQVRVVRHIETLKKFKL